MGDLHPGHTVLVAARTVTLAVRALDAVALFTGDHRVQVMFAVNESSLFGGGRTDGQRLA